MPAGSPGPGVKDTVEFEFLAEGAGATPVRTTPRAGSGSELPSYSVAGFPGGDARTYWAAHPQERSQLFHWVQKLAPARIEQVITTEEEAKPRKGVAARHTSYRVTGTKDPKGQVQHVSFTYLGQLAPQVVAVPSDYRDKDFADIGIEKAQSVADPVHGGTLGTVTIPPTVPAGERVPVKAAVSGYFADGARNTEVDAILPVPGQDRPVLYTLRFRPSNDVDVERIGEQGRGGVEPDRLDIARAPEYAAAAVDVTTLTTWLKTRYRGLVPAGGTVAELRQNANAELDKRAGTPEWFAANYRITVLDPLVAATRLRTAHGLRTAQLADLKAFQPAELRFLESVLETLSSRTLAVARTARFARQRIFLDRDAKGVVSEVPDRTGNTFYGAGPTIVIYDSAFPAGRPLFLGGARDVFPWGAEVFAHELGHVVASPGTATKKAFDAFVTARAIKPITEYSAAKPAGEFFPEAFQLFQTDPEWLQSNRPDLHTWFTAFTSTGTLLRR